MEKGWQVCEVEDSTSSFIELSVAAVPEIWIFKQDNVWWCYWPKTGALRKIMSREEPNPNDGKWSTYKCRILRNGEKFHTYKEAKAAEKVGQNFSILESETEAIENICNSTMNFNVSLLSDEDIIVGNDSCKFNEEVKGRCYNFDNMIIDQDATLQTYCSDEENPKTLRESDIDLEKGSFDNCSISDKSTYSEFKANSSSMLTSTVLEEDLKNHLRMNDDEKLLSTILKIETKISSFVNSIQNDFQDLKNLVEFRQTKRKIDAAFSCQAIGLESVSEIVNKTRTNHVAPLNSTLVSQNLNLQTLNQENNDIEATSTCQAMESVSGSEIVRKSSENRESFAVSIGTFDVGMSPKHSRNNEAYHIYHEEDAASSKENTVEAVNTLDVQGFGRGNDVITSDGSIETVRDATQVVDITQSPLANENTAPPKENVEPDVRNSDQFLRFPVIIDGQWDNNELLMKEEELEKAMIDHLLPLENEEETIYFNRTTDMLFDTQFLLDKISWKPEKKRVLLKNSNLLYCWKASHGKRFSYDIDDKRFKENIRRIKSAKRASKKADEKRLLRSTKNKAVKIVNIKPST